MLTDFKDFSLVNTEWFSSNLDMINSSITADNFYPEYFSLVLLEGQNVYFDEFLEKIRLKEELNSRSNTKSYKKVLSNAASEFYGSYYENNENEFVNEKKPYAYINFLFYPTLIVCGSIISFVIYTCLKFLSN